MSSGFFPTPSCNDGTDKLNYKWGLLLLLLFSLIAFIIPLHPFYNDGYNTQDVSPSPLSQFSAHDLKPVKIPTFKAVCWCPREFEQSHTLYTAAYCTTHYNAAIRGQSEVSVYRVRIDEQIPSERKKTQRIDPIIVDLTRSDDKMQKAGQDPQFIATVDFKERVKKLVTFQAPITLFLLAVTLGLSQVVWAFLADTCGSFNVGQTLDLVGQQSQSISTDDISESLGHYISRSPRTMSLLYLFKKFLSTVFVLGMILYVAMHALPNVYELQGDFDKLTSPDNATAEIDSTNASVKPVEVRLPQSVFDPFYCDMPLRALQNTQRYTIQCLPVQNDEPTSAADAPLSSSSSPSSTVRNLLDFESMMFEIVMAVLAILLISNVLSLCSWLVKLMSGSQRPSLGLHGNAPMDFLYVVQMARMNGSAQVALALARSSFGVKI